MQGAPSYSMVKRWYVEFKCRRDDSTKASVVHFISKTTAKEIYLGYHLTYNISVITSNLCSNAVPV